MNPDQLALVTFHLTGEKTGHLSGEKTGADLEDFAALNLHPALFAGYRDLSKLRYDFPLVLVEPIGEGDVARSLSGIVDDILQKTAPRGIEGERLRKHVLRLEEEIRVLVSAGTEGSLSRLWDLAAKSLLSKLDNLAGETLKDSLDRARDALGVDGEVIDCDRKAAAKLLTHAWTAVQLDKGRAFLDRVDRLIATLSNFLTADFMKSEAARAPESLKDSVGAAYESAFDFEAMSRILGHAPHGDVLPKSRRQRICSALSLLTAQRFFAPPNGQDQGSERSAPHAFIFDSCAKALEALQARLPEMVGLVKAVSIAELEIENQYKESKHDSFFRRFDESSLTPEDMATFPSYLVCLNGERAESPAQTKLMEVLASGLPIKVLAQTDDVLDGPSAGAGPFATGTGSARLASMAVGLNTAYVLQTGSSHLYQLRGRILDGLMFNGPTLFSIFSGGDGIAEGIAPYLMAASAMEARAFPAFSYDPAAGGDWASRFRVDDNPQANVDWPTRRLSYEGEDTQSISEDVAFTFVDFAACDRRYTAHFARVQRAHWHESMVPVREFLELGAEAGGDKIPYLLMVDEKNILQRVVVGSKLILAARHYADTWHSLQELGGINNSHARRLLDRERAVWQDEKEKEIEALAGQRREGPEAPPVAVAAPAATVAAKEEAAETAEVEDMADVSPDEAYIETARCTTCDECTDLNNRMFAYDENKQAYIADLGAGTYRELVEAAEACQVAIIHPGKPGNPDEPNLEELTKRAELFI